MVKRPAPPSEEPPSLDETQVETNLASIIAEISQAVQGDAKLEKVNGMIWLHPELSRPEYWMGNLNFDPASANEVPNDEAQHLSTWLMLFGYSTYFHEVRCRVGEEAERVQRALRRHAGRLVGKWSTIQRLLVLPGTRDLIERWRMPNDQFKRLCDDWIKASLDELLLESNQLQRVDKDLTCSGMPGIFPDKNRPDIHRFWDTYLGSSVWNYSEGQQKAARTRMQKNILPTFSDRYQEFFIVDEKNTKEATEIPEEKKKAYRCRVETLDWDAHLWAPILNFENLSQPGFMASLVYNRAAHHPAHFASRDLESTYIARAGFFNHFAEHWVRCFWELKEEEGYAFPLNWPESNNEAHTARLRTAEAKGRCYSHMEAHAILYGQTLIYGFIQQFLRHIWSSADSQSGIRTQLAPMITGGYTSHQFPRDLRELVHILQERDVSEAITKGDTQRTWYTTRASQYATPQETVVDFDGWERTFRNLRDGARTKLKSLMKDPAVFLAEAKSQLDHHPGQMADRHSSRMEHFHTDKVKNFGKKKAETLEDELAIDATRQVVWSALRDLEVWEHLHSIIVLVCKEIESSGARLTDPETQLCGDLRQLWMLLLHSLRECFGHFLRQFQHNSVVKCSPYFRKGYVRFEPRKNRNLENSIDTPMDPGDATVWDLVLNSNHDIECTNQWDEYEKKDKERGERQRTKRAKFNTPHRLLCHKIAWGLCSILPDGTSLSWIGMTNLAEVMAEVAKDDDKGALTPYVRELIYNMTALSRLVDDMERTRRIPFVTARKLRQEFEDTTEGHLGSYVFGPSTMLTKLASQDFISEKLKKKSRQLRDILVPLLQGIDQNVKRDAFKGIPYIRETQDSKLVKEKKLKHLGAAWGMIMSSITDMPVNNVNSFGSQKWVKKLGDRVNDGTIGVALARFLVTLTNEAEDRQKKERAEADVDAEIQELILAHVGDEEYVTDDEDMYDGHYDMDLDDEDEADTEGAGDVAMSDDETAGKSPGRKATDRPLRQRPTNSKWAKNRRQDEARRRGQRGQGAGEAAPVEEIKKMKLHTSHWNTFAALMGKNVTIDFEDIRRAMGAVGYSVRPTRVGSAWSFRWTDLSNSPEPDVPSISVHDIHGAAGKNVRVVTLRIGRRLKKLGISKRLLTKYYEGGPNGGWS